MACVGGMSWAELSLSSHSCRLCSGVLQPVWPSPERGSSQTFSGRAKRIITAAGTGSGTPLIPALALHCQKEQRRCTDTAPHSTRPARLPETRQGHPSLSKGIGSALNIARAQLLHSSAACGQPLLLSAQRDRRQCWKGQMSRRCCSKWIKMQT